MNSTMSARHEVLIVVPPNTNTVIDGRLLTVTRPHEHSDWSDFMSLGVLSLACAAKKVPGVRPVYIDGTVIDLDEILAYLSENHGRILAVCLSLLTANYEAGMLIANHTKAVDGAVWVIAGNDHFTALPLECMRQPSIDFGLVGNEILGSFEGLIRDLSARNSIRAGAYPSLVMRSDQSVNVAAAIAEPVFVDYDYRLIDEVFEHASIYRASFQRRISPRIKQLLGKTVTSGVPVDIGRGCVKFANNNACSFCSIQYGGMWKNSLTAGDAWQAIERAWHGGYDYLYLTADELPLTFGPLLTEMSRNKPQWWRGLSEADRPMMVGYARADGIADPRKTRLLVGLGIRQVMIGMDASSPVSLAAMNKPVPVHGDYMRHAETLYRQNFKAISVARDEGMLIRSGFVIGHLGMTPALLQENVDMIKDLISTGRDVISALDIEVLSPTPGSLDFNYLTTPTLADSLAHRLNLRLAPLERRERIAAGWRDKDDIPPELAMRDFVEALMPDVTFEDLAGARSSIRSYAKECGVTIGE